MREREISKYSVIFAVKLSIDSTYTQGGHKVFTMNPFYSSIDEKYVRWYTYLLCFISFRFEQQQEKRKNTPYCTNIILGNNDLQVFHLWFLHLILQHFRQKTFHEKCLKKYYRYSEEYFCVMSIFFFFFYFYFFFLDEEELVWIITFTKEEEGN